MKKNQRPKDIFVKSIPRQNPQTSIGSAIEQKTRSKKSNHVTDTFSNMIATSPIMSPLTYGAAGVSPLPHAGVSFPSEYLPLNGLPLSGPADKSTYPFPVLSQHINIRKLKSSCLRFSMYLCAALTCAVLLFLIGYIAVSGVPYITKTLLTTQTSYLTNSIGILPNILNTLYIIGLTLLCVLPIGIGAAIYLTEYATNKKLVELISFATETLTGIPSIIFGLVGMLFFIQILGLKQGTLAGALTLAIMVLPTIITNTRESLKTVPQAYREGALALGSSKWHMVRTVVLPNATAGIVTGCILAIGRITGESAALLFTAGFGLKLLSFTSALQSSSATLTVALYVYASEQGNFNVAFAIAFILLMITLVLNLTASLLGKKSK